MGQGLKSLKNAYYVFSGHFSPQYVFWEGFRSGGDLGPTLLFGAPMARAVQTVQPVILGGMMQTGGAYIENVSEETVGVPEDF